VAVAGDLLVGHASGQGLLVLRALGDERGQE
jgi:hypothetical protein